MASYTVKWKQLMPANKASKPHRSLHRPSLNASPVPLRLERWQRRSVYAAGAVLTLSGLAWLVAHFFLVSEGEYGPIVHPAEPWAMKIHGAAAMLMLFYLGSLLNVHIRRALKARRNLGTGWTMITLSGLLTASGYGLYYLAGEQSRVLWSTTHWAIGLAAPLALYLHIRLGRTK